MRERRSDNQTVRLALRPEAYLPLTASVIEAGDFSTLWRSCIGPPSQPQLASSLPNKRLSYCRLTGCGRNDVGAGRSDSRLSGVRPALCPEADLPLAAIHIEQGDFGAPLGMMGQRWGV